SLQARGDLRVHRSDHRLNRHRAEPDSPRCRRWGQRGHQSVHGHGGVRAAARRLEARFALLHAADGAVTMMNITNLATPFARGALVSALLTPGLTTAGRLGAQQPTQWVVPAGF